MQLNSEPDIALKDLLEKSGVTETIYGIGQLPKTGMPDSFIEIMQNGPISSNASQMGVGRCVLSLVVTVKLLTTGSRNVKKENLIISKFQNLFNPAKVHQGFIFSLDKRNLVFSGKDLVSGYSTKIVNIITTL